LTYGHISLGFVPSSSDIIKIEEFNFDEHLKKQIETEKEKIINNSNENQEKLVAEVKEEAKEKIERQSKIDLISRTDLGNITRVQESKNYLDGLFEADEIEDLKKEENQKSKKKKRKNKNKKKKNGNNAVKDEDKKQEESSSIENQQNEDKVEKPAKSDEEDLETKILMHKIHVDEKDDKDEKEHKFDAEIVNHSINSEVLKEIESKKSSEDFTVKLDFENFHFIKTDRFSEEMREQIKEECEHIKERFSVDEDEQNLEVVKADEGEFYVIKHFKPEEKLRSIMKPKREDNDSGTQNTVFFNLQDNEIRDFAKNSRVSITTAARPAKQKFKKEKKQKGKGKNRKKNQKSNEEREQQKIQRAERRRKEREELEQVASDDEEDRKIPFNDLEADDAEEGNDNEDEDFDACNAPSTRKHNSMPLDFAKSPFAGDDLLMHLRDDDFEDTKELKEEKEVIDEEE
jgi:hypothetical protein